MKINECDVNKIQELHEESGDCILIDVREKDEFAEASIPWARNYPLSTLDPSKVLSELPKAKPLYFICRSGRRSEAAAVRFADHPHD